MLRSEHGQQSVDAVVDVDVVERLLAVSEDDRILGATDPFEVLDDHRFVASLGVLLRPVNEEETADRPCQAVFMSRDTQQMLAGDLRRTVDGRRLRQVILGHRIRTTRTICVERGGEDHFANACVRRCVEETLGRQDVDFDRPLRSRFRRVVLLGSEVEQGVCAVAERVQVVAAQRGQVAVDSLDGHREAAPVA
ncbi:MAG: hypothetical protein AUG88_00735 [Actinobacteria bacterium 13_1_20CM_4_68_12]|nr:MAG: hypothetical protein AUG88_00735 [Actinobacteria bacterium 13_1_20CM_4_68_12]